GAPPPPPQPAAAAASAPAPVAPPVPYRFAGKVRKGAEEEVLISKGDLVFAIKIGDTLDGMYRVESIGADRIELLYLPLGTRDRIVVSSTLDGERAAAPVAAAPVPAPAQASPAPVADGRPAQLRWEGPERVQAGASFSVALRVNTKEALRAAPMQLRFEPGVLEPVNVRPGKFFGQGNFSYRVNPEGSIFVGATSPAAAPGSDAELLVVTFRPIKRGATAELSMSALSLQGAAGRAIAHEQLAAFRTAIQ
ncbi:MAG: cohesin domain-containing protein, partial [Burkholderiales bacterium]